MAAIQFKKRKKESMLLCLVLHSLLLHWQLFGVVWSLILFDISLDDWCMDKTVLLDKIDELKEEVAVVVPYATFGSCDGLERL